MEMGRKKSLPKIRRDFIDYYFFHYGILVICPLFFASHNGEGISVFKSLKFFKFFLLFLISFHFVSVKRTWLALLIKKEDSYPWLHDV